MSKFIFGYIHSINDINNFDDNNGKFIKVLKKL